MFKVRTGVAVAAMLVALAACGGTEQAADKPAATGPRVLKLWHYEGADSAMGKAWAEAVKQFEAAHPGVTVKLEEKAFEQIRQSAGMILNSDEAPDVMEYNKGNATAGPAVQAGPADRPLTRGDQTRLGQAAQPRAADHREVRRARRDGLRQVVRHPELRRVRDGLLQQGPVQEGGRRGAHDLRRVRPPRWRRSRRGTTPLAVGGAEYPAQQIFYQLALSKAQRPWVDGSSSTRARSTSRRPVQVRRRHLRRLGEEGLHRQGLRRVKAEDMGDCLHRRQVSDHGVGQLVVRPVRRRDQGLRVGHVPLPGQHDATPDPAATSGSSPRTPRTRTSPTTSSTSR